MAADMPLKAPPPIAVFSWTGCYAGLQVGYGTGKSRHTSAGSTNGVANGNAGVDLAPQFNVNGGLGGGEIGCNYQTGNWVLGVEIDGSWAAKSGQANDYNPPFPGSYLQTTSERWLAMARGRIGYAQDKWLWYVTGGGAWAGIDVQEYDGLAPTLRNSGVQRVNRGGWVVGFGTEYAVAYGWSVKWETLYMDFGTFRAFDTTPVACNCGNADIKLSQWVSRFGLNYKFDSYSPVVAKY